MLLALIGISFRSNSQVILNCGSFEPVFIDLDANGGSGTYTVPADKYLIVVKTVFPSSPTVYLNGQVFPAGVASGSPIPISSNSILTIGFDTTADSHLWGYLVDADGFGVQIDDSEEEFTSEGGIEIYPNPTGELASVFVDHQGTWDITVYDLNGQIVLESSVNTPVKTIDTNSLSSGTYIVSARAKRKLIGSSQLIVQ